MPHGTTVTPLTQAQFDIVAEWFARGLPLLDEIAAGGSAAVDVHDRASRPTSPRNAPRWRRTGWRAVNRDNVMAMFDCGTATDPKKCLADLPLASTRPTARRGTASGSHIARSSTTITLQSSYWTRSSPDGRFVAHGVRHERRRGTIHDLQRGVAHPASPAPYDPGFFPDNAGFVFQGSGNNVVLDERADVEPGESSAMTEPGCTRARRDRPLPARRQGARRRRLLRDRQRVRLRRRRPRPDAEDPGASVRLERDARTSRR